MSTRVIARFHPQAWVNKYAVEVDPEGEVEFDVTAEILAMGQEKACSLKDDDYDSDHLRFAASAPQWMKDWAGPFYVSVEFAISNYFHKEG